MNPLMKKNNVAVKASQGWVKHRRWWLGSAKAKGGRSTSGPRAGPDRREEWESRRVNCRNGGGGGGGGGGRGGGASRVWLSCELE